MANKLDVLIDQALRASDDNPMLYTVAIKEGLHRDILSMVVQSGLGREVTFQGGTALRLCYGNNRYSEDLDFVAAKPVTDGAISSFKIRLEQLIEHDYGAQIEFKDPKDVSSPAVASGISVRRWAMKVILEDLPHTNKTKQIINLEVAENIEALDARPTPISVSGARPIIMNVSSEKEIFADKMVALIGRNYVKARDIWDIKYLADKSVELNLAWVVKKCGLYGITTEPQALSSLLETKAAELAEPKVTTAFIHEMSRFLLPEQKQEWLDRPSGAELILMGVSESALMTSREILKYSSAANKVDEQEQIKHWRKKHNVKGPSRTP